MSLVLRNIKGEELTWDELDDNFNYLESLSGGDGNRIITQTGFSLVDQDLTINAGWIWAIAGVQYTNENPVVLNFPYAATSNQRLDLVVMNASSTFVRISGTESETNPVAPAVPNNTLLLTSVLVSDGAVGSVEDPILGTQFKKKTESSAFNDGSLSGQKAVIQLRPQGNSFYAITGAGLVSIDGFGLDLITGNPSAEPPYSGKDLIIQNLTAQPFDLLHDGDGMATAKFSFFNGQNLTVPPQGVVWLKYFTPYCEVVFKSWSENELPEIDIESQFKGHLYLIEFGGAINFIGFYANPSVVGVHTGLNASFISSASKPADSWNRRRVFLQTAGTDLTAEYYFPYVFCSVGTGFYYKVNIAFVLSAPRKFVGLNSSIIESGNVEPSTLTNCIMVAKDSTDSNFHLMHNDNSGTCTKIDLGSDFSTTGTIEKGLRLEIWNYKGDNSVNVRITNLRDNIVYETVISTDLPTETVGLSPRQGINTASENIASRFEISDLKIQLQN